MAASKRNLNNQASSAQTRLIMHFKTYLVVKTKIISHQWCKCKLHPFLIPNIRLKLSLWWMLREVCSTTRTKREKPHLFFRQFHASLREKPVFLVSEEIIILLTPLSTKLMYSLQKFNHHQSTLEEFSKPPLCKTVWTWWVSIQRSQETKRSSQVKKRLLLQCSYKMPVQ